MLNIISLSANRDKITWPWKVIKNLMKWLDLIWYPYVLNHDLNSTKRLLIHDDFFAIKKLNTVKKETKIILWPNLYNMPRHIPNYINLNNYIYLFPSKWIEWMWKNFWYRWKTYVWPVWIDTNIFTSSTNKKNQVLLYIKMRKNKDIEFVKNKLKKKWIDFKIINYWQYNEKNFKHILKKSKYVIWLWIPETQWIALQEILSTNTPILIWEISKLWDWNISNEKQDYLLNNEELNYSKWVTSAEYFDDTCWLKIKQKNELDWAIKYMEDHYKTFNPRKYILKNLSLEKQAKDFIELYNIHYWLTYKEWLNEKLLNNKKLRSNKLVNLLFKIYDSKIWKNIFKFINKILLKSK